MTTLGGRLLASAGLLLLPSIGAGQQGPDESFRFDDPTPAFEVGEGPSVCIDEGHFNFHTADGRYRSFAQLLRDDGYVDAGRAVFLGEAAMCSAQVAGPARRPMGMNQPMARQNPQFCLNVVRWLTRVID